jgi:predicted DNA-binding protein YlxM (UPF0122 family)
MNNAHGEQHYASKLTEKKVKWLRRMARKGFCIACLARFVKVNKQTVWDAINYKTWKHV